jgi:hypothetical protein
LTQTTAKRIDGRRDGRHYFIPEIGKELPSVTNCLDALTNRVLMNWAGNTEKTAAIEAAANLNEDMPGDNKLSRTAYIAKLNDRIGKTKAHQKQRARAAEIGTQAHALIEWHLRRQLLQKVGDEPAVSEKALWAFMAWEDWRDTVNLAPLAIEQTVWSAKHGYAGTMDLYCELDLCLKHLGAACSCPGKRRVRAVVDWKTGKAIYGEAKLQGVAYVRALIEMGHAEHPTYSIIVRLPKVDTDPEFEVKVLEPSEHERLMGVFLSVVNVWRWKTEDDAESYAKWKANKKP